MTAAAVILAALAGGIVFLALYAGLVAGLLAILDLVDPLEANR